MTDEFIKDIQQECCELVGMKTVELGRIASVRSWHIGYVNTLHTLHRV